MSETNFQFNNPLIDFLVKSVSAIYNDQNSGLPTHARKRLRNLTFYLDPNIKKALKDDIAKLQSGRHEGLSDEEFDRILNNIIDKLYEAGYFSPQQFRRGP